MSATLLVLALAAPAARAADETPSPWKFEFHGFVTGSMYYQDQVFANGQGQGLWVAAPTPTNLAKCRISGLFNSCPAVVAPTATSAGGGAATTTDGLLSGDVRNSRFSFSMAGPKVFTDAQPRAYLEFDFFGLNGSGTFGTEQPLPRLRVGYTELKFGDTNIQVGQQNQLVVQQIPGSISHIANPVTYQAGTIGWRTPGIRITQVVPMGDMKLTFAAEVVKNKWNREAQNAGTGNATSPSLIGEGEASGLPMFQGLARVDGKSGDIAYTGYLVGVYHTIDLSGFGGSVFVPVAAAGKKELTGYVAEVGGKVTFAPVSLAFNAYTGKATGNMLGSMLIFGDVKDMGYWASLSGNLTKEFSVTLTYGANTPDKADMRKWGGSLPSVSPNNSVRLANSMGGGMIKYQEGGYALALEGYQLTTTYSNSATTSTNTAALQVIATAGYFF
jgi:hypothetical protein